MITTNLVTLVTESDEIIGQMDKVAAHRGEGKLHRAISVYLFRVRDGALQVLLQQRSGQKIVGAHQWANTCCGNVLPGETYEECALRRLREELGIEGVLPEPVHKFRYQVQCNAEFSENEIDQVYAGWYEGEVSPNPDEVEAVAWQDWEEFTSEKWRQKGEKDWAPWFVVMLDIPELVTVVTPERYT